jgi:hypothetical protein
MTLAPWSTVSAARVPAGALDALAPVRDQPDVTVTMRGTVAWVRWPAGRSDVVRCLLPVTSATFFEYRDGAFVPFTRTVPTAEQPPEGAGVPVASVLVPGRFEVLAPESPTWNPVRITIARGGEPRPVTALNCPIGELAKWADTATTAELAGVIGARSGGRAILLGNRLPGIPGTQRYWGTDVLVPVGFRPDPDLPAALLRDAIGAAATELLLIDASGVVVIPRTAFEPLTRAGVRLGARTV